MKRYVLDACALVAFFNDEAGAVIVEKLLCEAVQGRCAVLMNKYNLLEVYYGYFRANGEHFAENILSIVENSNIQVCEVLTDSLLRKAGRFKASNKMSLADAMALSQAVDEQAVLVTADHHELDVVSKIGEVEFLWVR